MPSERIWLRHRLLALAAEAGRGLGPISADDADNGKFPDPLDEVLRIQRNQLKDSLRSVQRDRLLSIRDALARLDSGEYGICEECEEPIPSVRLDLVPEAPLCCACQAELEGNGCKPY